MRYFRHDGLPGASCRIHPGSLLLRRLPRHGLAGERQRGGGPAARRAGNELVLAVREAGLEVRLKRLAARADQPRAVLALRADQELQSSLINRIAHRHSAGLVESHQRGPSRVSVTLPRANLSPATVLVLVLHE